jgi:parvulin-like peptidyl-prolyl isomerase
MKVLRLLPLVLIPALFASCSALAVAAATVNGQRISEREVESQVQILLEDPTFGQTLQQDPSIRRGSGRREVLTTLIYTIVAEQEAKKRRITVSREQEDRLMEQAAQGQGLSVERFLKVQKLTLEQAHTIAHRLVLDSALQERIGENTRVTDEDIKQAYESNKQFFGEARLQRITVASQNDVRDALTKLGSGQDFGELARQVSKDPTAEDGGDLGWVSLSQLSPQEQSAIERAKPGGFTDPIPTQTGTFEIFKVNERRTKPLAQAAPEIRPGLERSKRQEDYRTWLQDRVRAAKIVVNPQYGRFDPKQVAVVQGSPTLRP